MKRNKINTFEGYKIKTIYASSDKTFFS